MFIKYLTEILPPHDDPAEFKPLLDASESRDQPLLASSLYAINYSALRVLIHLNNQRRQEDLSAHLALPSGSPVEHLARAEEATNAVYLTLKHASRPPVSDVASTEGTEITDSPWTLRGGYGLLWPSKRGVQGGPGYEFFTTSDKEVHITKAIYLHADPIDVVSTLFYKGHIEGDAVRDHMIKCSSYSYEELSDQIFPAIGAERDNGGLGGQVGRVQIHLDRFSLWAYKNQIDPFSFEASFDAWTASDNKEYPVLVVRYETMWDNLPAIAEFLELDVDSFVTGFPKKRKRKRLGTDLNLDVYTNLSRLYSSLITKRSQIPNIITVR
jgi:hypothetical protein